MTEPARVSPDGLCFVGNAWKDDIVLPTNYTLDDGTAGDPIDWTGSVFTADSPHLADGSIVVTPNLDADPPTATLSMDEATTALITASLFRWYLRESVVYGGDAMAWRTVKVGRES